jgi:hypothetical protein
MRLKPILTVLGPAKTLRAYYWCLRCRQGQFPADAALDIEDTELSPGVRRMLALVGSECFSFDHGRQQMELLADLEVTAKAVERVTETMGADIAGRQQQCIQQAIQMELPVAVGQPIQKIYVQMDGTGLPMVAKETEGRSGKGEDGRAHTRQAKLGCIFTQTTTDDQGRPVRDDDSTTYTGAIETAAEFSRRIYTEAHQRGWGRALNAERMRYREFRRKALFVGSGVIEAGCKTVIGSRLKRSGMRHTRKRVLDRPRRQRRDRASMLSLQSTI